MSLLRRLRCRIGLHDWAKHHREGEPYLACLRCGRESAGPSPILDLGGGV